MVSDNVTEGSSQASNDPCNSLPRHCDRADIVAKEGMILCHFGTIGSPTAIRIGDRQFLASARRAGSCRMPIRAPYFELCLISFVCHVTLV